MSLVRAAVGIIKREDKVLVGERPLGKPYSGYWEFPGGKIEANESGEEAIKRELREELGIEVLTLKRWFSHTHVYPDKNVLLEIWLITTFQGEPESKENQTLRWVNFEEMQQLRLLEGNFPIMEKIKTLFSPIESK